MKEARFYRAAEEGLRCNLCMHNCLIKPGRRGKCGVRENIDNTLYTHVYGEVVAEHIDPVEKKPLFHFLPGSLTMSIATVGCNFTCLHCQNHSLSQSGSRGGQLTGRTRTPDSIAAAALRGGCQSISYTYSEPTIFFEYAYDCCRAARDMGLKNIFVSNGYLSRAAAETILPLLDAINIDVKAYSEGFYKEVCGGRLQPVLDNVEYFRKQGIWVEVTTLIIPGLNDSDEELRSIASFLAGIDPDIVWHVSAFSPHFQMLDRPRTPPARVQSAREIGLEAGLNHVYGGNVHGSGGENTLCPGCGHTLIERRGFYVADNRMDSGTCPSCSAPVGGFW